MTAPAKLLSIQPYGSPGDPITGVTWQKFFQSVFQALGGIPRSTIGLVAMANAGAFPTFSNLGPFTVAALPATADEGTYAYATNGRKVGEGAGAGTGVPVYFSTGTWKVFSTDTTVAA